MATEIENQVVSMRFDSETFDRKINETIKNLDRLKASMNFKGAATGMQDISSASQKIDMAPLATNIQGISAKFLAMSTVAVTALATISTQAIQTGLQMAKSFTLGPIIGGFKEFETNMTSIQTILANTASQGTNLGQVNDALDKMNEFSDKTIYNFGEMARNLGTFTAAGVDLKTSESSIKGIANLAALSGSNSEQASSAMYQLSQAIAAGSVKLMDWNSVVNAGMGGEVFKKALFESGKAMGKFGDIPMTTTFEEWEKAGGSFREQLEKGWLTADVLTTTLSNMTGDVKLEDLLKQGFSEEQANEIIKMGKIAVDAATQVKTFTQLTGTIKESIGSGWSQSFRIMIGDFEESKQLWTGYNNIIGGFISRTAESRNELLQTFKDMGGRTAVIDTISQLFRTLLSFLKPIKDAFRDIFPPATAEGLLKLTQGIFNFLKNLELSASSAEKVRAVFRGLFAAIEIGWTIFKSLVELLNNIRGMFMALLPPVGNLATKFGDFFTRLNKAGVEGGGIEKFFHRVSYIILGLYTPLNNFKLILKDIFERIPFEKATEGIDKVKKAFTDIFDTVGKNDAFSGILNDLKRFGNLVSNLFGNIGSTPTLEGLTASFDAFQTALGTLFTKSETFGKITAEVGKFRDVLSETFDFIPPRVQKTTDNVQKLSDVFADTFDFIGPKTKDFCDNLDLIKKKTGESAGIASKFSEMWTNVVTNFGDLGNIFSKIGSAIGSFFSGIGDLISKAFGSIGTEEVFAGLGVGLIASLTLLANKIRKNGISLFKFDFFSGIGGKISDTLDLAGGALKSFQAKVRVENLRKIAISIAILAASLFLLSTIDQASLVRALGAVGASLGALIGALVLLEKMAGNTKLFDAAKMVAMTTSMTLLAGALVLMAVAVKILGSMSVEELAKGIGAISIMMGALAGVMRIMPNQKSLLGFGAGLILVAGALIVLAGAVKIYAMMDFGTMIKGMGAIVIFLGALGIAMHLFPKGPAMLAAGAGLLIVAGALLIMATAIQIIGSMKLGTLVKAMIAFDILLAQLVIAANAMSGAIVGAAAMIIMAGAMMIMAVALKLLGSMDMGDVATALIAIAGAIAIFVGFAALLMAFPPLIAGLFALGAALLLIGAGFALFGAGAYLAAKAFSIFAKSGAAGAKAFGAMLEVIGAALPKLMTGFAKGIIELIKTLLGAIPTLLKPLGKALDAILELIRKFVPKVIEVALELIVKFLEAIRDNIYQIATIGVEIVTELVTAISDNVQMLVSAAFDLITAFIFAVGEELHRIITLGTDIIVKLLEGITNSVVEIATAIGTLITTFIYQFGLLIWRIVAYGTEVAVSLLQGMAASATRISTALGDFITVMIAEFVKLNQRIIDAGIQAATDFLNGLVDSSVDMAGQVGEFIYKMVALMAYAVDYFWPEIMKVFQQLSSAILDALNPFNGDNSDKRKEISKGMFKLGQSMGEDFAKSLEIDSPSKVFLGHGKSIVDGLAMGLKDTSSVDSEADSLAKRVVDTFGKSIKNLPTSLPGMDGLNPVITPVLDLTGVQRDARQLSGMLEGSKLATDVSFQQARNISAETIAVPEEPAAVVQTPTEIKFEQTINAPTELSTADIYRQTRGQIALAKEQLKL